ncbi:MAG: CCA tRNA nucleotidyltransferase [archaeon]|jgi:tRNA nucleotidyltransferase (CCA-adding enzyme)
MNSLYKKVLKKITPSKQEENAEKALVNEIKLKLSKLEGKHSHLEWCGSSARGTHLKGDRDLDLFIMFDKKLSSEELEEEGLRLAKSIFRGNPWEKAYSQHPYIRGEIKGFEVEIVPSYIVASGAEKQSAVDRTPFHNKYLLKKLNATQKQEARLLKQFLKGINAYGADLKNQALPGYGVELLIVNYGSFDKAIKAISKWGEKEIIVFEKITRDPNNEFSTPLVIIDPVDENRNVASALSVEQYNKMKLAAKQFLKKPSEKFFFGTEIDIWPKTKIVTELKKREFLAIQADFPKQILSDLVWGQLRRYLRKATKQIEEEDFMVKKTNLWSDENKVFFLYELNTLNLPKIKKLIGPPITDVENVKLFIEKKRKLVSGPKEENGRITIEIERTETSAKKILQEYVNACKTTETDGMKICLRNAKVLTEKEILAHYKGNFAKHLTKYLEGKEEFE